MNFSRFYKFVIFFCILTSFSISGVFSAEKEDATLIISNAENFLGETFESILIAEQTGANISNLLDRMNLGGDYLNQANVMYKAGAYDDAILFADLCIETVNEIRSESLELIGTVELNSNFTIIWSIIGVIIVCIGGFLGWNFFKNYFLEQSKNVVQSDF
jgi:hypothetical protein